MNTNTDFDRRAAAWLGDGPTELSDRVLDAALSEVHSTHQRRAPRVSWRFPTMTNSRRLVAAIAVVAVAGGGAIWYVGQRTNPSPPTSTESPMPSFTSAQTAEPSPSQLPTPYRDAALGWLGTGRNEPGVYSWDGAACFRSSCSVNSSGGFMHNGYGSGDVTIRIGVGSDDPIAAGATSVTIAGRSGLYRRVVEPEPSSALDGMLEEWIVDIDGVVVAIKLYAKPGTSEADLAEARAIIDSLRSEPSTRNPQGFRLVFTIATGDWDSG